LLSISLLDLLCPDMVSPYLTRMAGNCLEANWDLAIKLPLPPGALPTLYNNDERYIEKILQNILAITILETADIY